MEKIFLVLAVAVLLSGCSFDNEEARIKNNNNKPKFDIGELSFDSTAQQSNPIERTQAPNGVEQGNSLSQIKKEPHLETQSQTNPINPMTNQDKPATKTYSSQPEMGIDTKKKYQAKLKTDLGEIVIELYADKTPITVNNFVFLARDHFYDQTIFHRTIKNFMIQGGDPSGNGTGGPGYKFNDEKFEGEYKKGIVAMANSGKNTNGSQFFIMHSDNNLQKDYVIFGEVVSGMEVVDKIATAPVTPSESGEKSKPVNPVKIESIIIEEK